jgi:hypothetical protein
VQGTVDLQMQVLKAPSVMLKRCRGWSGLWRPPAALFANAYWSNFMAFCNVL